MPLGQKLENVALTLKANIYFEGGVVSHTLLSPEGQRRTLGLIRPGTYHFSTTAAERMEILAGSCRAKTAVDGPWTPYAAGESFDVPADSSFDIAVDSGLAEYLCTFS